LSISKDQKMNFILYIKCTDLQDFNYSNPFYDRLKAEIPSSDILDMDNFSGQELIDASLKALKEAGKCSVVFDLQSENTSGRFLSLATYIADHPEKIRVFVNGTDKIVSKIIFPRENFSYHNLPKEELVNIIKEFFK
jgi:hypothetical protein